MRNIFKYIIIFLTLVPLTVSATVLGTQQGGTGIGGATPYSVGDLIYSSGATTLSKLAAGISGYVLKMNGGIPTWLPSSAGSVGTSTADVAGQVTFFTSNSATPALIGGSSNFVWDNVNSRLGIATSAPGTTFSVVGSSYIDGDLTVSQTGNNTSVNFAGSVNTYSRANNGNAAIRNVYNRYRGSLAAPTAVVADDNVLRFITFGYDGSNLVQASEFSTVIDGAVSAGQVSAYFKWQGRNAAGVTDERMRLSGEGKLGISTTSPSQLLSVQGNGLFSGDISAANINATGTLTLTALSNGCLSTATGVVTSSGSACGTGSVNSGTTGQLPYYAANGTSLTATSTVFINSTSNVGISTSTPWAKLSIGSANSLLSSPLFVIGSSSAAVATSTYLTVDSLGNFSIATSSDGYKVHTLGLLSLAGDNNLRYVETRGLTAGFSGGSAMYVNCNETFSENSNLTFCANGSGSNPGRIKFDSKGGSYMFNLSNGNPVMAIDGGNNLIDYGTNGVAQPVVRWDFSGGGTLLQNFNFQNGSDNRSSTLWTARDSTAVDQNNTKMFFRLENSSQISMFNVSHTGITGIGSTTPWAVLSIGGGQTLASTTRPLFAVASSSSAIATTTYFIIDPFGKVAVASSTGLTASFTVQGTTTQSVVNFASTTGATDLSIDANDRITYKTAGVVKLSSGAATVTPNVPIDANTLIFLTDQSASNLGNSSITATTTSTFTITSSNVLDASVVAWFIIQKTQ